MSVLLTVNLVKKEGSNVIPVASSNNNEVVELNGLAHFFFEQDKMHNIDNIMRLAGGDVQDFNFFLQSNSESYGDVTNKNRSFSATLVRTILAKVDAALIDTNSPWQHLHHYIGIYDEKDEYINQALVEYSPDDMPKAYCVAQPHIIGTHCSLNIFSAEKRRKIGEINLTSDSPALFTFDETKKAISITLSKQIKWTLNSLGNLMCESGRDYREVAISKNQNGAPPESIDDCYIGQVKKKKNNTYLMCYEYPSLQLSHELELNEEAPIELYGFHTKKQVSVTPKQKIKWHLKSENYYDWIKQDIEAILRLCDKAEANGLELQIWES